MNLFKMTAYGAGVATLAFGSMAVVDATMREAPAATLRAEMDHARVEVSVQARQLSLYRDGERDATYSIAVGTSEWPTKRGEWHIHRIDINPDWTPPEEEWAEDREVKDPGHPDNPMGRVRIVYDPPRSIHGTDAVESIGEAASHGSIRIRNEDGLELARKLMEASGDSRSSSWWDEALENETEMYSVELSNPIPIRVRTE